MELPNISAKIFHTYDVRGVYPIDLNFRSAYQVAHAFFALCPGQRYVIGYDMRKSSPELHAAFVVAAGELGKELDSLGMVATDKIYFAVGKFEYDGGIMITASHNPEIWNGIKLVAKGVKSLDMNQVKEKVFSQKVEDKEMPDLSKLEVTTKDYDAAYTSHVLSFVDSKIIPELKIVVDAGNGMGGMNARPVFAALPQLTIDEMYFEPEANFPHHEANPAVEANTNELSKQVVTTNANMGIAFDGDADRCFVVDEKGIYVPANQMMALLTKILLEKFPEQIIISDYRSIYAIDHEITKGKGKPVKITSGHSYSVAAMHEHNALFGAENSGHYYFRDNFSVDNGTIPFLLILEYLGKTGKKLSELVSYYREEIFTSGEHNFILVPGTNIENVYNNLRAAFPGGKVSTPDGLVMEFEGWRMSARPSNTEPKLRINVESRSQTQIDEAMLKIHEVIMTDAVYQDNQSDENLGMTTEQKFDQSIRNLWFTWNPHHILPIIDLYGDGWRKNTPPTKYLSMFGQKYFDNVLEKKAWDIDQNLRLLRDYRARPETWFSKFCEQNPLAKKLYGNPIAYFCMEYGLIDWLQIYSGGLGILAGDFIKQASDMGVPMVGVGIFYHQGYFHQDFDENGYQQETYIEQDPSDYPVQLVEDNQGKPLEVSIEIIDHEVWVRAWRLRVGITDLLLLDTNIERNEREEDRMISAHLYGGDNDTRVRQEILLGIGGPRILNAIGITPTIYHMNEGHSGFLVLEMARRYIEEQKMDFHQAIKQVHDQLLFTNHTLKQAGNDIFEYGLLQKFLGTYLDNLHTSFDEVFNLGRDQLYAEGKFSMTLLGLRNANISNAVSKLHGQAAKKLWPDYQLKAVTNGVHMPTWVSPEIHRLLDKYVGEDWHYPEREVDYQKVMDIPDRELWQAHQIRKEKLLKTISSEVNIELNPTALTIAWARRFASYKRPDLIMHDMNRLAEIVGKGEYPIQILLTGKAHPKDTIGKTLLQQLWQNFQRPEFKDKVVLIPGYNWQLARRMVSGADVWLNTPYRYEEASGTSGMKAAANGVLQFTTLDGWTDEVNWDGTGWVIAEDDPADSLYNTLANEICPMFCHKCEDQQRSPWLERMKKSMILALQDYSSKRMMQQYLTDLYLPTLQNLTDGKPGA
ncbi:alpha-glucan family phosphorylase [Candidatus Dojkabacteria bacterium]|uniref:Alpha-glucan family phosphorylase n=1 Tax=Candidatus Dojkabacteria bacterium TaxID=2099670 RepID=A0A955I6X4_9BACT|nr:alpha-glucan family phosphorylase [Candidatus Dojkabacteria bacterium]